MKFDDALTSLGVKDDALSDDEKRQLDCQGFVVLRDIFVQRQADAMRDAIESIFHEDRAGEPDGPPECGNLQNRSDVFDICFTNARVLAAVAHVLQSDFVSRGVHSRPNPPGRGHQQLHVDWDGPAPRPGQYCVCNTIWPLIDFTAENGATRVIPGSHLLGVNPPDALEDCAAPHPQEVVLDIPLGSVAIFNSHLWHGATLNRSDSNRPNVTSYWSRSTWPGRTIAANELSPPAIARLNDAARRLFDVHD